MSVINTNVNSLVSQASLKKNDRLLSASMEQLSTGKRINSAKDDAAGLAITSRMTSQIRGLNQAVRNANDGISLLQTAEGTTIEMSNMLQRMRELAVQSTNDTNTADDRAYLDLEYQQLTKEIARTGATAEWNGMKILSNADVGVPNTGSAATATGRTVAFQVGANADQTVSIELKKLTFGTGTPATATKSSLNLSADDLTDAKNFTFTIGAGPAGSGLTSRTFTFAMTTAPAAAAISSGEATDFETAMKTAITSTVGFENVKVTRSGTVVTVEDAEGRSLSALTAAEADGTAVSATNVATAVTATLASGATDDTKSLFTGNARLNDTNVTTVAKASEAIGRLDAAINAINKERATMGAVMNRLTYAADNLTNTATNTSASRSRILDTDYASATTELARTQIIQQAATAMLAQANAIPNVIMALIE